jgi:Glycine transporter
VAGLAAVGGGTVRDILLDRRPLLWVQHASWVWIVLELCVCAMLFMRADHLDLTERAMQWPDALGLGLFTAVGTQIAIDAEMPAVVAVILGMARLATTCLAGRRQGTGRFQGSARTLMEPCEVVSSAARGARGEDPGADGDSALKATTAPDVAA